MKLSIVGLWALLLVVAAGALTYHKVTELGFPLTPDEGQAAWKVEAKVSFKGSNNAELAFFIPNQTPNFRQISEEYYSNGYGRAINEVEDQKEDGNRQIVWTKRRAKGPQTLYYWISVTQGAVLEQWKSTPVHPEKPIFEEPYASAIEKLLTSVRAESTNTNNLARKLLIELQGNSSEHIKLIKSQSKNEQEWANQIVEILKGVRIPSRLIWGLDLGESVNQANLYPLLQVYDQDKWQTYNIKNAKSGIPNNFFLWHIGSDPLLRMNGLGNRSNPDVVFSVSKIDSKTIDVASHNQNSKLIDFSLMSLPVKSQNVYKILLVVPLGALLVVFLRTFVGISTFGTFMPILIALAFRETQLLVGIILFSVIIFLGLSLRFYLEKLRLLLVPRLTSILIIVVILMVGISLLTNALEIERALSLSLFPMVILAMTIERMSIVWEENGAKTALTQGAGSLFVACLGYLVMTNEYLIHLMFVFPELLLGVLAISLLAGRYTGYRLTELRRFRHMVKGK